MGFLEKSSHFSQSIILAELSGVLLGLRCSGAFRFRGEVNPTGCNRYHAYHGYQSYLRWCIIWVPGLPLVPRAQLVTKEVVYKRAVVAMGTIGSMDTDGGG